MKKNNQNKFNKTINPSGNEPPLSWWKFRKNRYITSNHPSITTKEKCAFKVETILSPQENQILEGLTRTLQTSKRDAVRIAIYELGKDVFKAKNLLKYANKETKERGHTSRSVECSCRVIKTEKESAKDIAKTFDISEKETVRLCIIWLGRKLNEINFRLTKCKRIGQEQLAREWSKEYDGSGSKLKKLKEASHAAYEDAAERAQSEVQKRQEAAEQMKWMAGAGEYQLTGDFDSDLNRFILTEDMEEEERMDKEFEQIVIDENIKNEREKAIQRILFFNPMFNRDMAEDWVNEDEREKKEKEELDDWLENATDEELIDSGMYFGIRNFDYFGTGIEPIWSEAPDIAEQEKRRENETAEEYVARAYPPEYVKDCQEKSKKKAEEIQAKRDEEKKQKKLRQKRDLVNDLTSEVDRWTKRIEELNGKNLKDKPEKELEEHQKSLKWAEDALAIQKKRLTDANYLDLYWDELSQ